MEFWSFLAGTLVAIPVGIIQWWRGYRKAIAESYPQPAKRSEPLELCACRWDSVGIRDTSDCPRHSDWLKTIAEPVSREDLKKVQAHSDLLKTIAEPISREDLKKVQAHDHWLDKR